MRSTKRLSNAAPVAMRMALAAGFLSAVADRFGLWGPIGTPGVSWGGFAKFLDYTATLLPYLSTTLVAVAGWAATVAEIVLGVALLAGVRVRLAALASGVLLLTFAIAMTTALGPRRRCRTRSGRRRPEPSCWPRTGRPRARSRRLQREPDYATRPEAKLEAVLGWLLRDPPSRRPNKDRYSAIQAVV